MESTNGAPPILEEARNLISRVPPGFQSAELRVIADAAQHIPRDEPVSAVDARILHAADRVAPLFQQRPPPPPTPFDDRITAAAAEEAEARAVWVKADEHRFQRCLDVDALLGSGAVLLRGKRGSVTIYTGKGSRNCPFPKREHVDAAKAAAQEAQRALELAEEAFKRARVARNELEFARGRWRAVAHLAVD